MKILQFDYQRNGVSGNGFYYMLVQNIPTCAKGKYLVSFEMEEDEKNEGRYLAPKTCRVVKLDDFYANWRGDNIAGHIQDAFMKSNFLTYYDWMESIRKNNHKEIISLINH